MNHSKSKQSSTSFRPLIDGRHQEHWETALATFLSDDCGVSFLRFVDRQIAKHLFRKGLVTKDSVRSWEDLSFTTPFQKLFDHVCQRMLTPQRFREISQKYFSQDRGNQTLDGYLRTRVVLVIREWGIPTQLIASRAEPKTSKDEGVVESAGHIPAENGEYPELEAAIQQLPIKQQAVFVLWQWPLETLPSAWRQWGVRTIIQAAAVNGQVEEITRARLAEIEDGKQLVVEDRLASLEARINGNFKLELFFRERKLNCAAWLVDLHRQRASATKDLDLDLPGRCYMAVSKGSEREVKAQIDYQAVYTTRDSGLQKVKSDAAYYQLGFEMSCFKEKRYRRQRLNAADEFEKSEPASGTMPHTQIAYILNDSVNNCHSNLNRAKKKLRQDLGESHESNSDSDDRESRIDDDLNRHVCENLT